MSVDDSRVKLKRAEKDLLANWLMTEETWRDDNRRVFEKTYIELLQQELRKSEMAMEHIGGLLNQMVNDCK